ncbi:MAG: polysaccharide deacetylase family protein, partial [Bacteroidetes bacterium]|nr:polysaccharide deacetylase family protein [Bacteroidota bacterium]
MDFISRQKIFTEVKAMLPASLPRESHRSVTEPELKEMSNSPSVTIGAHTVNHCSLNWVKIDEQILEIQRSIKTIEKIAEKKVSDFSYPFGTGNDFSKDTIDICKKAG